MRFSTSKLPKKVKFLGEDVDIFKLTVGQVLEIQKLVKISESKEDKSDEDGLETLMYVIRNGCPEFKDYSNDDIQDLPMDELTKLSNEIMKYSGLAK